MGRDEHLHRLIPGGAIGIGGQTPRDPMLRPAQIRDAVGRVLHEGDAILLQTQMAQLFKVERIAPVLEPGVPAGLMDITVVSVAKFRAVRDERNGEFLRVIQAEEAFQAATRQPGETGTSIEPASEPLGQPVQES